MLAGGSATLDPARSPDALRFLCSMSKRALHFVSSLLQVEPSARPTGPMCLQHEYFQGLAQEYNATYSGLQPHLPRRLASNGRLDDRASDGGSRRRGDSTTVPNMNGSGVSSQRLAIDTKEPAPPGPKARNHDVPRGRVPTQGACACRLSQRISVCVITSAVGSSPSARYFKHTEAACETDRR